MRRETIDQSHLLLITVMMSDVNCVELGIDNKNGCTDSVYLLTVDRAANKETPFAGDAARPSQEAKLRALRHGCSIGGDWLVFLPLLGMVEHSRHQDLDFDQEE